MTEFNINKEIEKMDQILKQVIKECSKEESQEELIDKIYKLTKENLKLKTQNEILIKELFLKGDNNQ